jgi:hypothetical protein
VPTGLLGGDYQYLNVDKSAQLCLSDGPVCLPSKFKFTKNFNGTFSIYSINKVNVKTSILALKNIFLFVTGKIYANKY